MRLSRLLIALSFLAWIGSVVAIARGDDALSILLMLAVLAALGGGIILRDRARLKRGIRV